MNGGVNQKGADMAYFSSKRGHLKAKRAKLKRAKERKKNEQMAKKKS